MKKVHILESICVCVLCMIVLVGCTTELTGWENADQDSVGLTNGWIPASRDHVTYDSQRDVYIFPAFDEAYQSFTEQFPIIDSDYYFIDTFFTCRAFGYFRYQQSVYASAKEFCLNNLDLMDSAFAIGNYVVHVYVPHNHAYPEYIQAVAFSDEKQKILFISSYDDELRIDEEIDVEAYIRDNFDSIEWE